MQAFTTYFTEAKVAEGKLEKIVDIFLRLMKRHLSTSEFYRFGGDKGYMELDGGKGLLYFYNGSRAIRFNYIKGELSSISLWNSFKLGNDADFTVDFTDTGLLQSAKKLIDVIKNPSTGTVEFTPNPFIEEALGSDNFSELMVEAKRVKPSEFFSIIKSNLPAGEDITDLSWQTVSSIAEYADVQIPGLIRTTKIGGTKGADTRFDVSQLEGITKGGSDELTAKITVRAGDTNRSSFTALGGGAKVSTMRGTIQDAIRNPNVQKEMDDPNTLFGTMKNLVQLICRKSRNSLVIYGGPGTGKTYTVTETIKREGLKKGVNYFVIKGRITTASLYQTLYLHRQGSLLVFDDTDSVWQDKDAANILKAALDSYDERVISWMSLRTVNVSKMSPDEKEVYMSEVDEALDKDPGDMKIKLPSEFDYQGRIIFISNLTYDKFDSAVLTRCAKIDMSLTDAQMFRRIESILASIGDPNIPLETKTEILDFIKAQNASGELRDPSMRTFIGAEDIYKSGLPNWRDLLAYL